MMILGPTLYAISKSTFIITIQFWNELKVLVIPTSASWSLTNGLGIVINSRTAIPISPLASTISVVLSGNDLKYTDGPQRVFTVTAAYNSTLGAGLPLIDSLRFYVADPESGKIGV